jgi:hypothetical protein
LPKELDGSWSLSIGRALHETGFLMTDMLRRRYVASIRYLIVLLENNLKYHKDIRRREVGRRGGSCLVLSFLVFYEKKK